MIFSANYIMAKTMNKRSGHKRSGHKRSGHKRSRRSAKKAHKRSGLKRTERKGKKGTLGYRKGSKSKTMKGKKDFTTKKTSKVFNRRRHYQKHAKGSRVVRKPYHKKRGGMPKLHQSDLNEVYPKRSMRYAKSADQPKMPGVLGLHSKLAPKQLFNHPTKNLSIESTGSKVFGRDTTTTGNDLVITNHGVHGIAGVINNTIKEEHVKGYAPVLPRLNGNINLATTKPGTFFKNPVWGIYGESLQKLVDTNAGFKTALEENVQAYLQTAAGPKDSKAPYGLTASELGNLF